MHQILEQEQRAALLAHAARYPAMQAQDAVKLLYQAEYGAGHLVADSAAARVALHAECAQTCAGRAGRPGGNTGKNAYAHPPAPPEPEPVGNGLARVHLMDLDALGWPPETLLRLFVYGANTHKGTDAGMTRRLAALKQCTLEGLMPFSTDALDAFLALWQADGSPLVRHSAAYRAAYDPAYRVVPSAHWALLDALVRRQGQRTLLAIDGNSGSGKSTLAALLAAVFDAAVVHMDDFFLPPDRKTAQRLAEPGGNVDYERVAAEVIAPHMAGKTPAYCPYDCQSGRMLPPVRCHDAWLTVIEGVYSLHPTLAPAYDLRAFLRITGAAQRARILERNGPAMLERFVREWIPLEDRYFDVFQVAAGCDYVANTAMGNEMP